MVFSNAIFDRLAKGPGAAEREDIQNDFPHELLDFNAKSNPLEKWVKHHEGRLGTVILGTYFQDLKDSMVDLYDFLKNFDVIETSTQIKGKIYENAIAYMQNELEQDKAKLESKELEKQEAIKLADVNEPQAVDSEDKKQE